MQNMETPNYNSTQQELYLGARMGWKNYGNNLAKFTAFRPRYTLAYGQECIAEIDAAQKMQTNNASSGASTKSLLEMTEGASECLLKWQSLKRYIVDAYKGAVVDAMLKAAGQPNYTSAGNNNWPSVVTLMNEGSVFIADHINELLADDNMPPDFGDVFNATRNDFLNLYDQYLDSTTNGSANAQDRIKANNAIYEKLSNMLQDGQQIFAKNEGIKQKFVFVNLKALVSGVGQAGLHGIITDANTNLPIMNATVASTNNTYSATTDDTGRYDLLGMAAGDYTLTISAADYTGQLLQVTVKTGTLSTQNASLQLAAAN